MCQKATWPSEAMGKSNMKNNGKKRNWVMYFATTGWNFWLDTRIVWAIKLSFQSSFPFVNSSKLTLSKAKEQNHSELEEHLKIKTLEKIPKLKDLREDKFSLKTEAQHSWQGVLLPKHQPGPAINSMALISIKHSSGTQVTHNQEFSKCF